MPKQCCACACSVLLYTEMLMTDNQEQFDESDLDEIASMNESLVQADRETKLAEHRLSTAQQAAALRALRGAGIDLDIDLRSKEAIVTQDVQDSEPLTVFVDYSPPSQAATNENLQISKELFPEFKPKTTSRTETDLEAFNAGLQEIIRRYDQTPRQPYRQPQRQSRFASFRERFGERLHSSTLPVRKAVGAVALAGLALLGGALATHGGSGDTQPVTKAPATTSSLFEAPTTTTSTITVSRPEAAPAIDLSNQATADALGQMIVSFDEIRVQMTPTATEAQIQAAQIQALDYAAALDAASA